MEQAKVGVGDVSLYVPSPQMRLDTLFDHRVKQNPLIDRRLRRAIELTGQKAFRFPQPWEDSATLAAQSAYELLNRNPQAVPSLRFLAAGTETTVDHSKPIAAYVEGMLQNAGVDVPETISTFQVQHACAGGAIAMLGIAAQLVIAPQRNETGLVISTDVARYDAPSTAEITQGAGAISMLIETNPRLIELDLATQGYYSRDVDDFFRPIGSVTAKVKGGYSMQCYNESLDQAFHDHCRRSNQEPEDALSSTDMFVFHVPFKFMALNALHRLVSHHLHIHGDELNDFIGARGFEESLEPNTKVGNLYTASTFLAMSFLLRERHEKFGNSIVGKKIMMASYGSGNTMILVSGRVAEGASEVIRSWDLDAIWRSASDGSIEQYEAWLTAPHSAERLNALYEESEVPRKSFYLSSVRDDGYREYLFKS